jgi:hypothetical protein
MTENQHSIQKVFLEIDTPSMRMADSIKVSVAMFLEQELIPILEKQFNLTENTNNQILQIEKLEISIHLNTNTTDIFLSNNEAKNDIKTQIEKEIRKALNKFKTNPKEEDKNGGINTISSQEKDIKTLLYFIENGSMPWWVSKDEIAFFEKINFDNIQKDAFRIPFQKLMQQKKNQNRIINQFSNQQIALFVSVLFDSEKNSKTLSNNNLLKFLNNKSHEFKTAFWKLLFDQKKPIEIISFYYQKRNEFLAEKIYFELFIQNLKAVFPLSTTDDEFREMNENYLNSEKTKSIIKRESDENNSFLETKIQSKKEENFQEEELNSKSAYVQNAGLIILHPFLKEMLKNCDLIGVHNTILNKELAAHILHYAATKTENDYEHTMLFEKFLCGIPMQESIPREIKIEEKHKQQVEEMLLSVVEHWSALKNTSTAVLRSEFLQREGKLDWSESNPKLTIERKTQDLLLEKIPWNITIVKIPWIEKLIYTQW